MEERVKKLEEIVEELKAKNESLEERLVKLESEEKVFSGLTPEEKDAVSRTYAEFADLVTEKINSNWDYSMKFTKYIIEPWRFKKMFLIITDREQRPEWWRISTPDEIIKEINNYYDEIVKATAKILLGKDEEKVDDTKMHEYYCAFIEQIMRMNSFKRFNDEVLLKAAEKFAAKSEDVKEVERNTRNLVEKLKDISSLIDVSYSWGSINYDQLCEKGYYFSEVDRILFCHYKNSALYIYKKG